MHLLGLTTLLLALHSAVVTLKLELRVKCTWAPPIPLAVSHHLELRPGRMTVESTLSFILSQGGKR